MNLRRFLKTFLLAFLTLPSSTLLAAPEVATHTPVLSAPVSESPSATEARRLALETAGAFTNDGFRIRDAEWPFTLTKGTPQFLKVALFAGNRYWFVTASPMPGVALRVTLYNDKGSPVKSEQWQDGGAHEGSRAAAGIAPERSGEYFVGVEIQESSSDLPLDCSLVIAYK